MRVRLFAAIVSAAGALSLVVVPTVSPVWAAPRPVEPDVTTLSVALDVAGDGAGGPAEPRTTAPGPEVRASPSDPVETGTSEALGPQAMRQPADRDGVLTLVSPEVELEPFALLGARLPAKVRAEDVEVRVRQDGQWGEWNALPTLDGGPDADTAEHANANQHATASLWVGDSNAVQTRIAVPDSGEPIEDVQIVLVNPGSSPADGAPGPAASADAATAAPRFVSRAQWGADESLRCSSVSYSATIKAAVVHHTAGPNTYSTQAEAMRQLRADYAYHTKTLGWCDLGYNFVVDKWGNIYEGRAGGVDRPVIGAHAGGFNRDTFGVSMLGDYSTVAPSAAMVNAVTDVVAWKLSIYERNPWASTTLTSAGGGTARWPAGTVVNNLPVVMGHRNVGQTACPGNRGFAALNTIRDGALRQTQAADFVQGLYADLLGRAPSVGELDGWTRAVAAQGDRWVGVRGFSGSEEFRRRFVSAAYVDVLGRQPDSAGLNGWVADIAAGRATLDDLRMRLMQSPEFYLRAGGTDAGFVNSLYQRSLNRNASATEQAGWAAVVAAEGRFAAVQGIWNSYESALRRVDRSYTTWLVRPASAAEQDYWSRTVITAGDEAMREAAMVSPEYLARAMTRF